LLSFFPFFFSLFFFFLSFSLSLSLFVPTPPFRLSMLRFSVRLFADASKGRGSFRRKQGSSDGGKKAERIAAAAKGNQFLSSALSLRPLVVSSPDLSQDAMEVQRMSNAAAAAEQAYSAAERRWMAGRLAAMRHLPDTFLPAALAQPSLAHPPLVPRTFLPPPDTLPLPDYSYMISYAADQDEGDMFE